MWKVTKKYDEWNIQTFEGIDAVRKRPGMYVRGGITKLWWHSLFWEVYDNSVDEYMELVGENMLKKWQKFTIKVELINDTTIVIEDSWRWIPVWMTKDWKNTKIEQIFTKLHTWWKFSDDAYEFSWGLHWVWTTLVTALSTYLKVIVWRDWKEYEINFKNWYIDWVVTEKKHSWNKTWTRIEFSLDKERFEYKDWWDAQEIRDMLYKHKFLMKGAYMVFDDKFNWTKEVFENSKWLQEYIEEFNKDKEPVISIVSWEIEKKEIQRGNKIEKIVIDYAFQVTSDQIYHGIEGYANTIYTPDWWFHCKWLEKAIIKWVKNILKAENFKKIATLTNDDILKWLKWIISIRLTNPNFEWQAKSKLNNEWVEKSIQELIATDLENKLKKTEITALKQYYTRVIDIRTQTDDLIKKIIKKNVSDKERVSLLWTKLYEANSKNREECELYIVEWDSAWGWLKQVRDTKRIALLPLKGKPKNIERSEKVAKLDLWDDDTAEDDNETDDKKKKKKTEDIGLWKMLQWNVELQSLIYALWCGFWKDFDIKKLRYWKIVILADWDEDGRHITALLLWFFYKFFPELISLWKIYEWKAPSHKITNWKNEYYVYTNEEKDKLLSKLKWSVDVQRLKGLWEMQPEDLYKTCVVEWRHVQINNKNDEINQGLINNLLWNSPWFRLNLFKKAVEEMIDDETP